MAKAGSKTYRFTHLRLENWRNFTKVEVDLQRRVFLVGANASGKSNFLDVFRFLKKLSSVGGGLQQAVQDRGGVSSLRCLAARRYTDILVNVRVGDDKTPAAWEYELRFNQDNRRRPIISRERVLREGAEVLKRPRPEDQKDQERLTQTYLEQVQANQDFRELARFFASVRYYHIVPQLVRDPDRSVGKQRDPYGGDFIEQIALTPERTRRARLRRINEALKVAVPQLKELELERDERGTPHLKGNYKHWRPRGAWQREDTFSDGTLRLMGLLWALLDGSGPMLLEEPELSLHPEVVQYLPETFARVQRRSGRQVLISTHSSDLLKDDVIGLDEALLLRPAKEGTVVSLASSHDEVKALLEGGLNLAEVLVPMTRPENAEKLPLFPD
ncbi:MAG: AAA family ATPase [Deltaproteobacteria bacterium]|nr:AAA family ATPase [Deltaproteobacteria bacterium]